MSNKHKTWTAAAALLAAGLVQSAPALAAPLGNLRDIEVAKAAQPGEPAGSSWDVKSDAGVVVRISLLRPDVLRLWAGTGGQLLPAKDGTAHIVVAQYSAPVKAELTREADYTLLRTEALALRIYPRPLRFALYRADNQTALWQDAQPVDIAKDQTVQTLAVDRSERFFGGGQQNGSFEFHGRELNINYSGGWEEGDRPSPAPFLMSSRGWGMLRNTWSDGSYDLRQAGQISLLHREARLDAYFFVGADIRDVLARYTELTGRAGLLPRWAFEYGDADCYNDGDNIKKPGTVPPGWSDGPTGKTPDVIDTVARKYREHDMPGGWILPNDGYGCGYTDLPKVVRGLKELGFRTGLWTESGVDKIAWEVGTAGTRVQKLDVAWTGQGYQFSLDANKSAYDGILNNSDSRPFLWTVMGWAGTQRYAVTWTGDQSSSWDYIRWHIPTLIGSGLSGQAYATGDVDAIFGGSPETFTRDLQWKSFTPVLMGMSGWASAERKHPWAFEEPYRSINRRYLKLKLRMTPYMYTLAHEAEASGAPLVRGLMWDYPADPGALSEAYKYQFLLGRDLLVAPVYRSQAASQGWRKSIHLPGHAQGGRWIDYWDGRSLSAPAAGRDIDRKVALDEVPVFVRAGSIIPMYPEVLFDGQKPKDRLTLDLYPQGDSAFLLYEDDGNTRRYQQGESSTQRIAMQAPLAQQGDVSVQIDPVQGRYDGQEARRAIALRVLSRAKPDAVELDGRKLPELDAQAYEAAAEGWRFDASERLGTVHVKTVARDIRVATRFALRIAAAPLPADDGFPAAPPAGRAVPVDSLSVVNRPSEEPGHPFENALDDNPETWFRTTRNQAIKTGPFEWVLSLGERRLIDGIEIAPRTDANWKYGQIRDYEIFMGDNNGDWGEPVARGRLKLQQAAQRIEFKPHAGRLLRMRVLSTQDPEGDDANANDPMVLAAGKPAARAYNAMQPQELSPLTISSFKVLEHPMSAKPEQMRFLSDLSLPRSVGKDGRAGTPLKMNGLLFRKGVAVAGSSRVDFTIQGDWRLLRADLGVDDSCKSRGGLQFEIWGDGRLLYDSGLVKAPGVVKPEIDVRGLSSLSLRTLGATGAGVCANWANAVLIGQEGDSVAVKPSP